MATAVGGSGCGAFAALWWLAVRPGFGSLPLASLAGIEQKKCCCSGRRIRAARNKTFFLFNRRVSVGASLAVCVPGASSGGAVLTFRRVLRPALCSGRAPAVAGAVPWVGPPFPRPLWSPGLRAALVAAPAGASPGVDTLCACRGSLQPYGAKCPI